MIERTDLVEPRLVTLPPQSYQSSWILLVAGGILQLPALTAAHQLDYKVVVTDRNPECACAELADHFVEMDTFDAQGHVDFVRAWPHGFAAVFTAAADPVVTVARAAQAAECHGLLVEDAKACADKTAARWLLFKAEVPQPQYEQVWCGYGMMRATLRMGCPAYIVKATHSSGSRGHTRGMAEDFQSEDFCDAAYLSARKHSIGRDVLIEELLTGKELSVESLWISGQMFPLNAVERPFMDHPQYAIELGHYNPAILSAETYKAVWDVVERAGRAIGMGDAQGGHIFKADLILTDDGPKVLEVTPRLSGGFDSGWTTPLAHGADYTKGALLLALGKTMEAMPYFAKRWHRHAACLAAFGPDDGGIIREIRGLDAAREFGEVILRYDAGDELPPLTSCAERVAFVITSDSDPYFARKRAEYAVSRIKVVCE